MKKYVSTGKIEYKNDGWVIMNVDKSLINYYKFWVERFAGRKLSTSYHGSHVTVVAGKYDKGLTKHPRWKEHHGELVKFQYDSYIYTDRDWFCQGEYFWLRIHCNELIQIRTDLGLKPTPFHPFHSTIGFCQR